MPLSHVATSADLPGSARHHLWKGKLSESLSTNARLVNALHAPPTSEFGPNVRTLCVMFSHQCHMTQPKIAEWFANMGILISDGQISYFLTEDHEAFHREKEEIVEAGLSSSPWQHMDDTGTRVDGVNWHCQVICNPLYTAYFTTARKDRLTAIDVLRNGRERVFRLNDEAMAWLRQFGISQRTLEQLRTLPWDQELSEAQLPSAAEAMRLSGAFDELFSTVTGYAALDQRIAKTKANKGSLLMVLRHPEIPLHNNPAELGARGRVRKRVVSYGPRSVKGAQAWDTFQTILGTAKNLGVNCFH